MAGWLASPLASLSITTRSSGMGWHGMFRPRHNGRAFLQFLKGPAEARPFPLKRLSGSQSVGGIRQAAGGLFERR